MINIKKFFKLLLISFFILIMVAIIGYIGIYIYAKASNKLAINSANGYYLYDKEKNLISGNKDEWVKLKDISPYLIKATISVEDKNFYKHQGFDYLRIIKAMFTNIIKGDNIQGASTITQQVAKNFLLSSEVSYIRKLKEAILAGRMEKAYTKEHILELYLNEIYLGNRSYGVAAAALNYFDKALDELTIDEAAYLAALPKGPNNYNPKTKYNAAIGNIR